MIADKDIAQKAAEFLLQIKAVQLNLSSPFQWSSGWKSPIYCDNRVVLSFPAVRTYIREMMVKSIERHFPKPDVVAGVATGAIAIGALVADELGLPFIYVRPEPKSHGRMNQIEGYIVSGQNIIVIEDLISTGKSSLNAIKALKQAGLKVLGVQAIFSYGFDEAHKLFESENIQVITLSDYEHLIKTALKVGYINENELKQLNEWRLMPDKWGQ
ncbi:orotate phosphoribosyltransferase [Thermaurantimonas aggregans]|uniref:Orotate phosphoribosyltransferase n=1 Tax=Thermaurantimonas aggregans TaxID=2173829 RepID=A0A401XJB3_9FLAO|nr:orotate phosphoribosyltransferase [Thermaurantimonas aggregans]MCX8148661.1 orotate phosphoribosyltransferase [Thermaurantimonas aggregans]GCD77125.1 orotate phosphoribosyltransferase [Thermaurantimonas aggregans]